MTRKPSIVVVAFIVILTAVQLLSVGARTCYGQQGITIIYSGDVRGYIDPCG